MKNYLFTFVKIKILDLLQNRKNAIMTRTLLFGTKICLITLMFCSCYSVKNLQKSGKILIENHKYYINDSLKFSYRFGGDYQLIHEKSTVRKSLRNNRLRLNVNYCLAYYQTDVEPLLDHYLFYFKDAKTANRALARLGKYNVRTPNPIIDSANYTVAHGIVLENNMGYIYIIGKNPQKEFIILEKEYINDIFQQIKIGKNYANVDISDPFTLARKYDFNEDSTVNYLLPLIKLQQNTMNYAYNIRSKFQYIEALGTFQSRIGNLDEELNNTLQEFYRYSGIKIADSGYLAIDNDVLDFLIEKCKEEKIVMFNENHFSPNNRLLLHLLLQKLYNSGFKYFGLEMLWEKDINERGFVVSKSGFYTCEPMAANLIKKAKNIGFQVFYYESFKNEREKEEAQNIYNNTFRLDSLAKVVILAGFGHINENISANKHWMAAELKKIYNIDPLTISQTSYYVANTNNWLAVVDTIYRKKPALQADIYLSNNLDYSTFAKLDNYIDYSIELPDSVINRINKPVNNDYIISVYRTQDYQTDNSAIPAYNYMIKKPLRDKIISIPLQKDEYIFFVRNEYNELIFSGNMKIT
ncbi:MAG: hypothetical protein LBF04_06515 [Prevotellaceae bacterium]|jgi:hypothetical protein|nr:hypothetical protein [Prevotellaceae bacterium]